VLFVGELVVEIGLYVPTLVHKVAVVIYIKANMEMVGL